MVAEDPREVGRRALALGGDDHPVAVGQQLSAAGGRWPRRRPAPPPTPPRRHGRRVGRVRRGRHRPRRARPRRSAAARRRGGAAGRPSTSPASHVRARVGPGRPPRPARRRPGPGGACGSTSITCAVGRQEVGEQVARRRPATAASSPCRRRSGPRPGAPTARAPTARPRPGAPRPARTSAVGSSSRAGTITASSIGSVERWSWTENSVSRSTSSPQRSIRTGASAVDGNTSMIDPRRATSPRCSTSSSRR